MVIRHAFTMLSIVLVAFTLAGREARAEFQALGLVATGQPTPMQCQDGLCTAYLSAFCLEKDRPPPPGGATYRPAEKTEITLIVETAGGGTLRLAGRDWLRFEAWTGYTGVLAIVDETRVGGLDPARMSLEVGPMASLLPIETEPGGAGHSAEEIALATGPYRQTAQKFFEEDSTRGEVVSFAARLINSLPRLGNVTEDRQKVKIETALADFAESKPGPETRTLVDRLIGVCHVGFPRKRHMSMRICIEQEHSVLQVRTNNEFWTSLGGF